MKVEKNKKTVDKSCFSVKIYSKLKERFIINLSTGGQNG
jgi:hypothetical protein